MKNKVSLVLSGGGARGVAHIGVIEELIEQGYAIESISGTSMGAVVGGLYAANKLEEFKSWLYTLDKRKVFGLLDFTISSQALVKGDKIFNSLREFVKDTNIEDLSIPFSANAADIINRKEVVFTSGNLLDAMRASVSIPTVFTPVKINDSLLVDGGVLNNIPVNNVKRVQDDKLIVVNVNAIVPVLKLDSSKKETQLKESIYKEKMLKFNEQLKKIHPLKHKEELGYFSLIDKTISLMMYQMALSSLEHYTPDTLINISRDTCTTFDFYKAEELVEIGRLAARKALEQ